MAIGASPTHRRISIWLKIPYTLFVCVLVPKYWSLYGPANFLWFCDMGLLVTALALWIESPLLISMEAIALTMPQILWTLDFLSGGHIVGISHYMFKPELPITTRALSTFHLWLPWILIWLVWRLGYDRRAAWLQTLFSTALLLACYFLTDPRHPPTGFPAAAVNVNRVFGLDEAQVQTAIPPLLFLAITIVFYPLCIYLPTHLVFKRIFRRPITNVEPELSVKANEILQGR
jgi:hypothetical protein